MCGIAGILRWGDRPPQRSEIEGMTRSLAHRGPDAEGLHVRGPVAIGHRRLAIIDLATGNQPLSNETGTVWITYNGELYNYRDLRTDLCRRGHTFRTQSDTEVIVHAYEEWGVTCVERFRGMFAFAVVDYERQRVFLARDHFGIKPLYYRLGPDFLGFCSELSALQSLDAPGSDGNVLAIEFFLRFQYIPAPHTIYRDVFKLPPATNLVCEFDGRLNGPSRYWCAQFSPDERMTENDGIDGLADVLQASVKAHLVADVPFGVLLSGGIDSTLVARAMAKLVSPLNAFTLGFAEPRFSEVAFAEEAARKYGLNLQVEVMAADTFAELPVLLRHHGEPFGDDSTIPTSALCRLARSQVPMVLAGDGGDELFGGYGSYAQWLHADKPATLRQRLGRLGRTVQHWHHARERHRLDDWLEQVLFFPESTRKALWKPEFRKYVCQPCELFQRTAAEAQRFDRLAYAQYLDINTYLPGAILPKVDVASMAHGLEVRVPFLDVGVFEFAARIPQRLLFPAETPAEGNGKALPKKLLEREFPAAFVHRRKQGFTAPHASWFRAGSGNRAWIEDVLFSSVHGLGEWFNADAIRALLRQYDRGDAVSKQLWLLFVLGVWRQQNAQVVFR